MGMGSYVKFAWRDAIDLAILLEETYDPKEVYDRFKSLNDEKLQTLEMELRPDIVELIASTVSRRPGILKKIDTAHPRKHRSELALLFAIIGQTDAEDQLLRMKPGGYNRTTCADCYAIASASSRRRRTYEFPRKVFRAFGSGAEFFGEFDD